MPRRRPRGRRPRRADALPGLRSLAALKPVWSYRPRLSVPPGRSSRRATGQWLRDQRTIGLGGRAFDIYLPAGLRRRSPAPMVLLLHGCRRPRPDFADATRFTTVADRHGVILVLPRQERQHQQQRLLALVRVEHQQRGHGEPAILAASPTTSRR